MYCRSSKAKGKAQNSGTVQEHLKMIQSKAVVRISGGEKLVDNCFCFFLPIQKRVGEERKITPVNVGPTGLNGS